MGEAIEFAEVDGNTLFVVAGGHERGGITKRANVENHTMPEFVKYVMVTGGAMAEELNENRFNVEEVVESGTSFDISKEDVQAIQEAKDSQTKINTSVTKP